MRVVPKSRLLIVGINYWPEETGIGPYTTGFAEQLAAAGAAVTVATALPHYPMWEVPAAYAGVQDTRELRNGVTVHRVRPRIPGRMSAASRAVFEASFGWRIRRVVTTTAADAVIAVVPSLAGAAVGKWVARTRRVPFGLIFQDLMGRSAEQSGTAGKGLAAATAVLERTLATSADQVGVVATGFATFFTDAGVRPERVVHLPNWCHIKAPAERAAENVRRRLGWSDDKIIVLHAGNMGAKQALENVIAAARVAAAERPDVHFVLMGDGSRRAALEECSRGVENLEFLERQSVEQFPHVLAAADMLLVNERATVRDMSLPSKLTSYFTAGRPVIAAARSDGTTAAELHRAGGGIVVPPEDPHALVHAVANLAFDRTRATELGAAGRRYAQSYLGEAAAAERSVAFVSALLNSRN